MTDVATRNAGYRVLGLLMTQADFPAWWHSLDDLTKEVYIDAIGAIVRREAYTMIREGQE